MALFKWSPSPVAYSSSRDSLVLLLQSKTEQKRSTKFEDIVHRSISFPIKFPTETVRCATLQNYVDKDKLEKYINSVYPVVHESVLKLYCDFIIYKRNHGSNVEKTFYKDMTLTDFINRLLMKRSVCFVGRHDHFLLRSGEEGSSNGKWETIGTNKEKSPLILKDCLSYDEIKLAAFLSVSSYTYFVNVGDRRNMSKYSADRSQIEDEGIIIGLIGPRMVRRDVMDFQEIIITEDQNTNANGYGSTSSPSMHTLFAKFYEDKTWTYKDVKNLLNTDEDNRFIDNFNNHSDIFDNLLYHKRLTFSFDTLLMEANERAKEVNKYAYIHVVGLGLGVWKVSMHQEKLYVESLYNRIMSLGSKLNFVSDICLSYIDVTNCGGIKDGEMFSLESHPLKGIRLHILKRNPHEKLQGPDVGKLLVVSYAWDGNSLPGNEFWVEHLAGSGDSAAASSTQISEIHNAHINPSACADNLRVVWDMGVTPFEAYQAEMKRRFQSEKCELC